MAQSPEDRPDEKRAAKPRVRDRLSSPVLPADGVYDPVVLEEDDEARVFPAGDRRVSDRFADVLWCAVAGFDGVPGHAAGRFAGFVKGGRAIRRAHVHVLGADAHRHAE